ncbi:MAG: dTDP-4-dehydrorhamnose 3,5-epimerase [Hyphomicrobium sp.]|nr:MAG: dTDP-4-dehydrorhamnose 3,5-epimerase [Hyphomicrobium sp.]PPD01589.1 MAG: dTDP-4-dehydrorhamnose 3,5-epimerase [Hyphomicrobium sp.]
MLFQKTRIEGPRLITLQEHADERGFFARTFCERKLADEGLVTHYPQHSVSYNVRRGTIRGMHFQNAPHGEAKIVRCTAGAIFDVIVDVRQGSTSFGQWEGFELSAGNHRQLYIPEGFAHGFQTLMDATEISYLISAFHAPFAAMGFPFDDATVAIAWPLPATVMSEKDRMWPALKS